MSDTEIHDIFICMQEWLKLLMLTIKSWAKWTACAAIMKAKHTYTHFTQDKKKMTV